MKRLTAFLLCFYGYLLMGQNIDITEYSQNLALKDTVSIALDSTQFSGSYYPSITETYQIPAYNLYDHYWDVKHLRSKVLDIPFANDRLMLILVQEGNHNFVFPCIYDEITCAYGLTKRGDFHPGVDLSVDYQTLVKSCFDGVVRMAKPYGDYGLMVVVRHYNGLETVYAHLGKLFVKPGQIVNAGDVIGQTGHSGNVKDNTLHFETRFMNEHFDPAMLIDFDEEELVKNTLSLSSESIRVIDTAQTGVSPKTPTAQPNQSRLSATPDNANATYHIVQKGESLYRISQLYQTTIDRILKLNNLDNPDKISEGQRLRVK